jgi:hypothetical protein
MFENAPVCVVLLYVAIFKNILSYFKGGHNCIPFNKKKYITSFRER